MPDNVCAKQFYSNEQTHSSRWDAWPENRDRENERGRERSTNTYTHSPGVSQIPWSSLQPCLQRAERQRHFEWAVLYSFALPWFTHVNYITDDVDNNKVLTHIMSLFLEVKEIFNLIINQKIMYYLSNKNEVKAGNVFNKIWSVWGGNLSVSNDSIHIDSWGHDLIKNRIFPFLITFHDFS